MIVEVCNEDWISLRLEGRNIELSLEESVCLQKQLADAIFMCQNYPQDKGRE